MVERKTIARACGFCRGGLVSDAQRGWPSEERVLDMCVMRLGMIGPRAKNSLAIHVLRHIAWLLRTTFYDDKPSGRFTEYASMLRVAIDPGTSPDMLNCMANTLKKMVDEPRATSTKSIFRQRFFLQHYTAIKTSVRCAMNAIVTQRHSTAAEDLFRVVNPGINYARNLAVQEAIYHNMTLLTPSQLYGFSRALTSSAALFTDLWTNVDFLNLMTRVYESGRAYYATKLLQVNPSGCTCRAKCVGQIGRYPHVERRVWTESFELHCALDVCGACRLAFVVENAQSVKPRRTYSSITPEVQSCSVDACSSIKRVRLVTTDVRFSNGRLYTDFAHRFYTSSSINMMNDRSPGTVGRNRGKRARLYGVCYGGRRTCKRKFTIVSPAGMPGTRPAATDVNHWYTCASCQGAHGEVGSVREALGLINCGEDAVPTCLMAWYDGRITDAKVICKGCKLSSMCRHFDQVLAERPLDSLAGIKRVGRWIKLRHALTDPSVWNVTPGTQ